MSRYKTPRALEMAVKAAARKSPMETGAAVEGFFFHRLLVRLFADGASPFVLKGGHGMLARTADARRTRDIDVATDSLDADEALDELRRLISRDMDDFLSYEVVGCAPIKLADRYRHGFKVDISVSFGGRRLKPLSVDLVADEVECGAPDLVTPADRLDIDGLPACDYPVYPVAKAITDKLFGIVETHNGHPSSRVKDLVDLAVYATHERVDGTELVSRILGEASLRKSPLLGSFTLPEGWHGSYERVFERLAKQTSLVGESVTMSGAEMLVARLLNPALDGSCVGMVWNPDVLAWEYADGVAFLVRPIREEEIPLLWDFIYGAIYVPEGYEGEIPRSIVTDDPKCRAAVEGYGTRPDDLALVAEAGGRVVGACWVRTTEEYGHIDDETPSFSISVLEPYRGRGIGGALMQAVIERLRADGCARASLSVQKENPALRLYQRLGFRIIGDGADESEWLMVLDL